MTGRGLGRLALVPDEPDQVLRLHHFQEEHPDVIIGGGDGYRQARIPEENGETVITRYSLRELLDKLDGLIGGRPIDGGLPDCAASQPPLWRRAADGRVSGRRG
jgi:hypothetical protein